MADGDKLALRLRSALAKRKGITEKKMFGGTCFMLHDHMLCAGSKRGLLFRVGKEFEPVALARPGATVMEMNGRRMRGFVRVNPERCKGRSLAAWITLAEQYVATLPPKKRRTARKAKRTTARKAA